jgi:hypothetical protein
MPRRETLCIYVRKNPVRLPSVSETRVDKPPVPPEYGRKIGEFLATDSRLPSDGKVASIVGTTANLFPESRKVI